MTTQHVATPSLRAERISGPEKIWFVVCGGRANFLAGPRIEQLTAHFAVNFGGLCLNKNLVEASDPSTICLCVTTTRRTKI
jgi:hypothetical protein